MNPETYYNLAHLRIHLKFQIFNYLISNDEL